MDPSLSQHKRAYNLNERVLCQHTDNLYYDAKVVGLSVAPSGARLYTIHYKGWSKRYDETFEESKAAFRLRPFTESDFAKAKAELKAAQEKSDLAKRAKPAVTRKRPVKKETEASKESVARRAPRVTNQARCASVRAARALAARAKTPRPVSRMRALPTLKVQSHGGRMENAKFGMDKGASRNHKMSAASAPIQVGDSQVERSKCRVTEDGHGSVTTSEGQTIKPTGKKTDGSVATASTGRASAGVIRRERPTRRRVIPHYESDAQRPFYDLESKDLPLKMKELLKKDMEQSLAAKTIPRLPARSSVSKILNEFAKYMQKLNEVCGKPNRGASVAWKATASSVNDCVDGLKDLFDEILLQQLLTEKEIPRHKELLKSGVVRGRREILRKLAGSGLRPCEVYGYIHLLRMLVDVSPIPQSVGMADPLIYEALKGFSNCLNLFLINHSDEMFNLAEDYLPISAQ